MSESEIAQLRKELAAAQTACDNISRAYADLRVELAAAQATIDNQRVSIVNLLAAEWREEVAGLERQCAELTTDRDTWAASCLREERNWEDEREACLAAVVERDAAQKRIVELEESGPFLVDSVLAAEAERDAAKAESAELREALVDMVSQHCRDSWGKPFYSTSTEEDARDILANTNLAAEHLERDRVRDAALEWYADTANWQQGIQVHKDIDGNPVGMAASISPIKLDGGRRARAALGRGD